MKKTIIYSALLAMGMSFTTSCSNDFMELNPVGAVSESTLANDEGINMLLAGAYSALMHQSSHNWTMGHVSLSNWVFGDVIGGDANKGSTAADQPDASSLEQWRFDGSNSYLTDKWTACYEAVKRANGVLKVAATMENGTQYEAEARFIKGVQMFEAIKVFGAHVPYITLEDYLANNDPQVTNHDESGNLIYVWDKVAEDLKFAYDNLPDSYDASNVGHINKWAAAGMLAKLYLYWSSPYNGKNGTADHWNDAYTLLKTIISSGVNSQGQKFALVPNYKDNWSDYTISDNNTEGVFEIQQAIDGTAWYPATQNGSHAPCPQFITGGWGFYQPSYQYTNSFIVDEKGLPLESYEQHAPLATVVNSACVSDLDTYVDPRLDVTAGRFDVPYWDWTTPAGTEVATYIREVSNAGLFFNKKYVPMKTEQGKINDCPLASNKNMHVMRYSEVLLMAAECAIHAGETAQAVKYINEIRKRAQNDCVTNDDNPHKMEVVDQNGNVTVTKTNAAANYRIGLYDESKSYSADEATKMLKREIRLEIGMEGNRWFNLARWGNIKADLAEYAAFENQYIPKYNNVYDNNWVTLPIPSAQITASDGRFAQNDTWK